MKINEGWWGSTGEHIFWRVPDGSGNDLFELSAEVTSASTSSGTGTLRFRAQKTSGNTQTISTSIAFDANEDGYEHFTDDSDKWPEGVWRHVVGTWSETDKRMALYVDGERKADYEEASSWTIPSPGSNMYIGNYDTSSTTQEADAVIDDFAVWDYERW